MGCAFECVYCYLQGYTNAPGIVVPGNLDEILEKFHHYYQPGMRLGTGQFTDSLFMDDLTGFAPQIIDFFRRYPDVQFEFKTKSDQIENILATPCSGNVLVSWSVNPQRIIDAAEPLTSSLDARLRAATKCSEAGYGVGFHFDPIIFYDGWADDYRMVVDKIFGLIDPAKIRWISLGCLRMTPKVKQVMEQRFPESALLLAEQIMGFDGKLRYARGIRKRIYDGMMTFIRAHSREVTVYLCMEDEPMNRDVNILPVTSNIR
jgi:spore photoproduct lyase